MPACILESGRIQISRAVTSRLDTAAIQENKRLETKICKDSRRMQKVALKPQKIAYLS